MRYIVSRAVAVSILFFLPEEAALAANGYVCSMIYHGSDHRRVAEMKKFSIIDGTLILDSAVDKYAKWSGDKFRILLNNNSGIVAVRYGASSSSSNFSETYADTVAIDKVKMTIRQVFVSSDGKHASFLTGSCMNF